MFFVTDKYFSLSVAALRGLMISYPILKTVASVYYTEKTDVDSLPMDLLSWADLLQNSHVFLHHLKARRHKMGPTRSISCGIDTTNVQFVHGPWYL